MTKHARQTGERLLKRGGAHNLREQEHWQLSEKDCRKILAACQAAYDCGAPMTRWTTLAWENAGIDPIDCGRKTSAFLAYQRDWLRQRGFVMPWCWTLETGNKYGAHAHLLSHVPPELDPLYSNLPRFWVTKQLGGTYVKDTLYTEALLFRSAAYANPAAYWAELCGKIHYMLKTAPAELEAELSMIGWGHAAWGQRCKTFGKRAGVWQFRKSN